MKLLRKVFLNSFSLELSLVELEEDGECTNCKLPCEKGTIGVEVPLSFRFCLVDGALGESKVYRGGFCCAVCFSKLLPFLDLEDTYILARLKKQAKKDKNREALWRILGGVKDDSAEL